MNLAEMQKVMLDYCRDIDQAIDEMRQAGVDVAVAERVYRNARSDAWGRATGGNVRQREAWVDARTAEERAERDKAENRRRDAIELVKARQAELSAYQTLVTAHRAEAEFVRTGP